MRKISPLDRVLIFSAVLLASYQVVSGIEGLGTFAIASFTVGFGFLLIAGLLVFILGFEVLDSAHIVVISTIIPLSLSLGLLGSFLPAQKTKFLFLALAAFAAVIVSRYFFNPKAALLTLVLAHASSGLVIVIFPIIVCLQGRAAWLFCLVSLGGTLIGLYGILLSFLKAEKSLLPQARMLAIFPLLLFLVTAAFVSGFSVI